MVDGTARPDSLAELARQSFLRRYAGGTLKLYTLDLRLLFEWCGARGLDPLQVKRLHLESFMEWLLQVRGNKPVSVVRRMHSVRGFYRLAVADELIDRDPTLMLRFPKVYVDRSQVAWLDRWQMARLQKVAAEVSPAHGALVALMSSMGLRVSEACAVRIEDFTDDPMGYRLLSIVGKGGVPATMPVPVPLLRIIDAAVGDRSEGFLILTRRGRPQTRNGAYDWIKRLAKRAELPDNVHPHSLRHSGITNVLENCADPREAQRFGRHADVRTTLMIYDRRPFLMDTHPAHVVARHFAAAA